MEEKIKKFVIVKNIEDYKESLLFDNGIIARLETDNYAVNIEVFGDKKIVFENTVYRYASNYPSKLVELLKTDEFYLNPELEILDNNWFNICFFVKNEEGLFELEFDDALEIDIYDKSNEEIKEYMYNALKEYIEYYYKEENVKTLKDDNLLDLEVEKEC